LSNCLTLTTPAAHLTVAATPAQIKMRASSGGPDGDTADSTTPATAASVFVLLYCFTSTKVQIPTHLY
jgi:hypothetical protein